MKHNASRLIVYSQSRMPSRDGVSWQLGFGLGSKAHALWSEPMSQTVECGRLKGHLYRAWTNEPLGLGNHLGLVERDVIHRLVQASPWLFKPAFLQSAIKVALPRGLTQEACQ